ncbi:hypothetical protein GYB29_13090 [bacterium]|nr:hypothetical protein [bacterium]
MSDEEQSEFSDIEEKISASKLGVENKIKWISLVLITLSVYQWYTEGPTIIFNLRYFLRSFDFSMLIMLAPAFVLPLATFLFWKKLRYGWILLAGMLSFTLSFIGLLFIVDIIKSLSPSQFVSNHQITSGALIAVLILFVGIWYIMKSEIRLYYDVSRKFAKITVLSAAILSMILVLLT